jgi:hypothetical protein
MSGCLFFYTVCAWMQPGISLLELILGNPKDDAAGFPFLAVLAS